MLSTVATRQRARRWLWFCSVACAWRKYRKLVRREDATRYWNIVPKAVKMERDSAEKKMDEQMREDAELQSNCGQAIQDDSGAWISVMDESVTV